MNEWMNKVQTKLNFRWMHKYADLPLRMTRISLGPTAYSRFRTVEMAVSRYGFIGPFK